jgi:RNA polymerase sigma factor (TIGR02999 family)
MVKQKRDPDLTTLLTAWTQGDQAAFEKLSAAVYQELKHLARHYMQNERRDHTLQPTALVHEVFVRLIDWKNVDWKNRAHFFSVAAQVMRRVLVDHARSRRNLKRGGEWQRMPLSNAELLPDMPTTDLLAINDVLEALEKLAPRKSQVVELRFFGGLTAEETAEVLNVSTETVLADWRFAKTWLLRELTQEKKDGKN